MDHQFLLVKVEPDDFNEVPGPVRADDEHFGWVGVRIEFDDGDSVVESVEDRIFIEAMLESGAMDIHTVLL